jgi:hypothetical protein
MESVGEPTLEELLKEDEEDPAPESEPKTT